jgi:hypothetical protein
MDYELLFIYLGYVVVFLSAVYFCLNGSRLIGLLFVTALLLQLQGVIFSQYVGLPEGSGECWANKYSYYDCLPFAHKLTTHAAQLGQYIFAIAIFLAAKSVKQANVAQT